MLFLIYFQFLTLTDLFKQWKSKTMLQTKEEVDLVTITKPVTKL